MKLKNIFVLVLALCMVFALCACGGDTDANNESTASTTNTTTSGATEETVDDGKVTYTVKVVDENNEPIVGAMVQLCLDACIPAMTNLQGVATYRVAEAEYKVSFVQVPVGYTAAATEYYFAAGSYELTITLTNTAA